MELSERIKLYDPCDADDVSFILDSCGIDFDWDSADRLMVSADDLDEVISLLEKNNIEYDEM